MESAAPNDLIQQHVLGAGSADSSPTVSESRDASELLTAQSLFRRFATVAVGFVLLLTSLIMGNLYKAASAAGDNHLGVQAATERPLTADLEASLVGIIGDTPARRNSGQ